MSEATFATFNVQNFKEEFPDFAQAGDNRIKLAIEDARTFVDETAFGVRALIALKYKTAALLAGKKYGQVAPLKSKGEVTDYEKKYQEILQLVPLRGLVL